MPASNNHPGKKLKKLISGRIPYSNFYGRCFALKDAFHTLRHRKSLQIKVLISRDEGLCHAGNSLLIYTANQWVDFYIIETSVTKELKVKETFWPQKLFYYSGIQLLVITSDNCTS